jgi:hypothetical protein
MDEFSHSPSSDTAFNTDMSAEENLGQAGTLSLFVRPYDGRFAFKMIFDREKCL